MDPRPEGRREIPRAVVSLISICLSELRKDVRQLLEAGWPDPVRRRAHELAAAVEEACARQGMEELSTLARSIASLARLSPREALPLRPALRAKFEELLAQSSRWLSAYSGRRIG